MRILLVAATTLEIQPVLELHPRLDVLITGVGVPLTLWHLHQRLSQMDYDLVIQAGIAGSFHSALQPGAVVLVSSDAFGDLGIYEQGSFIQVTKTSLASPDQFPFQKGILLNPAPNPFASPFPLVQGITVNTVTDDRAMNRQMQLQHRADIETMEGAALHFVCLQLNQPFMQVRSISNMVGIRDKSQWQLDKAVSHLAEALHQILLSIPSSE